MRKQISLPSRWPLALTFTMALGTAACGVAVDSDDPGQPVAPDLRPDIPGYSPDEDGKLRFHEAQSVIRQSPVRGTAFGGNADGVSSCSYGYEHYEHGGEVDGTQLHVIGVYQSDVEREPQEHKPGPIDVNLNRPGKSMLVLSAYEPVNWNIHVAPGATLTGVVVNGYYDQQVNAPEGVPVARYVFDGGDGNGRLSGSTAITWPSYETTELVDTVEQLTELELTSFRGCYEASSFDIDAPGELRPPHEVSPATEPGVLPGCEAITAESSYCMINNGGGLEMIGLDSGAVCGELPTEAATVGNASLGWMGDYVYSCVRERGLVRTSVLDGTSDVAPIPCEAVTIQGGSLVALVNFDWENFSGSGVPWYVARFASFEDVVARNAEEVYEMAPFATRMAANGDTLYFAWHSTSYIDVVELADGAEFQPLELEDFDNWVMGMDVTDDGTLVLASWFDTDGLYLFDATTGAFKSMLPSQINASFVEGMDCYSNPTE